MKAKIHNGSAPGAEQQEMPFFLEKRGESDIGRARFLNVRTRDLLVDYRELIPIFILFALVLSVSWHPMGLGALLVVLGAFWPYSKSDAAKGSGTVSIKGFKITMNGSLRIGVMLAGIVVLILAFHNQAQQKENGKMKAPPIQLTHDRLLSMPRFRQLSIREKVFHKCIFSPVRLIGDDTILKLCSKTRNN